MEARLGHDFSRVRVHTGGEAAAAARALRARAYTVGDQVAFAPGEYERGGTRTRELVAHELVHVLQQRAGGGRAAGPEHEREASALAGGNGAGPCTVAAAERGSVQRAPAESAAPATDFVECEPALQSDLAAKHPVALQNVSAAIASLAPGWTHMAPAAKAAFARWFDPAGTGDVDDAFVRDVRANFGRIHAYMRSLTFDCKPDSGSLCGSSKKWCVGGRLMWTCFGNLHVCTDAYRATGDEPFKIETMIHESVHNALHVTDRAYSNRAEFGKLRPRPGGVLGFLASIPILGALFTPLVKLFGSSDTLYNPDSYARYAMDSARAS